MPFIRLSDGTEVHVRIGKRGVKVTKADIKAIEAVRDALERVPKCPDCGRQKETCSPETCEWLRSKLAEAKGD